MYTYIPLIRRWEFHQCYGEERTAEVRSDQPQWGTTLKAATGTPRMSVRIDSRRDRHILLSYGVPIGVNMRNELTAGRILLLDADPKTTPMSRKHRELLVVEARRGFPANAYRVWMSFSLLQQAGIKPQDVQMMHSGRCTLTPTTRVCHKDKCPVRKYGDVNPDMGRVPRSAGRKHTHHETVIVPNTALFVAGGVSYLCGPMEGVNAVFLVQLKTAITPGYTPYQATRSLIPRAALQGVVQYMQQGRWYFQDLQDFDPDPSRILRNVAIISDKPPIQRRALTEPPTGAPRHVAKEMVIDHRGVYVRGAVTDSIHPTCKLAERWYKVMGERASARWEVTYT
jgi:hypothetical protein